MNVDALQDRTANIWRRAKGRYKLPKCNFKLARVNYNVGAIVCNGASAVVIPMDGVPLALIRIEDVRFENTSNVLEEIIPHELAHIICQLRPELGHSYCHDEGWQKVLAFTKGV